MSAFAIGKAGVQILAALGVTRVVTEVIKNNTVAVTTVDKILINTGGFVLGSIVVDHASDRVNYAFEKFDTWNEKRKEEAEAAEQESKNGDSKDSN
jgi:hypothetical protein